MSAASSGLSSAAQHLETAQGHTQKGATFGATGFQGLAQYHRSQAQMHTLAARRDELQGRMNRIGGGGGESSIDWGKAGDPGLDHSVLKRATSQGGYAGPPEDFAQNLNALETMAQQSGFSLNAMTPQYPEEVGRMARAYQGDPHRFDGSSHPLLGFANLAGADNIANALGN